MTEIIRDYLLMHAFAQTPLGKRWFAGVAALLRFAFSSCLMLVLWSVLAVPLVALVPSPVQPVVSVAVLLGVALWWFRRRELAGWWERRQQRWRGGEAHQRWR